MAQARSARGHKSMRKNSVRNDLVPRVVFLCSMIGVEKTTLDQAGHVALVDKHFPTGVVFTLYFDTATGRKRVRLTRHF